MPHCGPASGPLVHFRAAACVAPCGHRADRRRLERAPYPHLAQKSSRGMRGLRNIRLADFSTPLPRWGADNGRTGQARPAGARTNQATAARLRQGGYVICFSHLLRTPASTTRAAYSGAKEALMRIFKKLICMSAVAIAIGGGAVFAAGQDKYSVSVPKGLGFADFCR